MATRRTNRFNPDVDPALLSALETVGGNYAPYDVELFSGYRPGDPRFHGKHSALDVNLIDRETGKALPNYQNAESAQAYQAYANAVYNWALQNNPELAQKLRWGGYFSGGPGTYGAMDLMHFDVGGGPGGTNMAGGSWEGGFSPEQMKAYNIASAGGIGTGGSSDWRKAFLDTIASGESPGYDVMYGGQKFTDYSRHPHAMQTVNGVSSDAAGKYQFLGSTWDEQAKKYGYKDFSAENQDLAAWNYASDIYKTKTGGGSLEEALRSGDPARINAAAAVLNQTWTSLPGGKEASKGYGDKTFYDIYSGNMKAAPTVRHPPNPTVGKPADDEEEVAEDDAPWNKFSKAMGDIKMPGLSGGVSPMPAQPAAALAASAPVPFINPQQADMQRQNMAAVLARLNSGKLV